MPSLPHIGADTPPFRPRVVSAVRDDLQHVPADSPVTLVARPPGEHLHQIIDPAGTAGHLVELAAA
ncbi:hypothetical protein [Streptomyces griseoluteus]|uniref:hypothetical protein n=1 Tax=Streptomyces griseoluteus TaxID=29306 RepID=UPI001E2DE059|nr:hypothetical protein [Streptomyces griseoluteus]